MHIFILCVDIFQKMNFRLMIRILRKLFFDQMCLDPQLCMSRQ